MRIATILISVLLSALIVAGPAGADYGAGASADGAELISADYDRLEQGDDTTVYAAVSADGDYVVIQTRARNFFDDTDADPPGQYRAGGLFRFELATQDLVKVADGDLFDEATNNFLRRGASNPSVSADGRHVAFATAQPLVAADVNDNVDIYVRDMDVAIGSPGAFDLVSARDGGDVPASYDPPTPFPGSNAGSDITRGAAISGDGRRVIFRTDVPSDLPASGAVDVPGRQVFVRDRLLNTTTLMTRTDPGGQPAGGAFGSAISQDGTTVTWTGNNAPVQTRFLNGESIDPSINYYLWRRIADGPSAPTRRITGVSDPDDPDCPPGQTTSFDGTSTGPCYGPLGVPEGQRSSITAQVPALSADGLTVAFLSGAGPRPAVPKGPGLDLFVTDMRTGVTRKGGTSELTRASTASADPATGSAIAGMSMAPDGRHIAIVTARTAFTLPGLTPTGPSRTIAGTQEVYAIDLVDRTLDRVALSNLGGDINGDVSSGATISNGGERVAFTSFAGNLFFGDANQRPDAFVATAQPDPDTGPPPVVEPPPPPTTESPRLNVRVQSLRKGRVVLEVGVPAAGGLTVLAKGRAGKPRIDRSLAKGTGRTAEAGTITVPLQLVDRYRSDLAKRGKLKARARLDFVYAIGGEQLSDVVSVVFRQKEKGAGKKGGKGKGGNGSGKGDKG